MAALAQRVSLMVETDTGPMLVDAPEEMLLYGTGVALGPADAITQALDNTDAAAQEHGLRILSVSQDVTMIPEHHAERASALARALGSRDRPVTERAAYASVAAIGVEPPLSRVGPGSGGPDNLTSRGVRVTHRRDRGGAGPPYECAPRFTSASFTREDEDR